MCLATPVVTVSSFSLLSLYSCSPRLFVYISVYLYVRVLSFVSHFVPFFFFFPRPLSGPSLTAEQNVMHTLVYSLMALNALSFVTKRLIDISRRNEVSCFSPVTPSTFPFVREQ
jgi:hypothetical protein